MCKLKVNGEKSLFEKPRLAKDGTTLVGKVLQKNVLMSQLDLCPFM